METWHKLLTLVLAVAVGTVGMYAWRLQWERDNSISHAEVRYKELQAKWDKEREWMGRYREWRKLWVEQHPVTAVLTPIEPFMME